MGSLYAADGGKWGEINGKFQARFVKVAKSGSDWSGREEQKRKEMSEGEVSVPLGGKNGKREEKGRREVDANKRRSWGRL